MVPNQSENYGSTLPATVWSETWPTGAIDFSADSQSYLDQYLQQSYLFYHHEIPLILIFPTSQIGPFPLKLLLKIAAGARE